MAIPSRLVTCQQNAAACMTYQDLSTRFCRFCPGYLETLQLNKKHPAYVTTASYLHSYNAGKSQSSGSSTSRHCRTPLSVEATAWPLPQQHTALVQHSRQGLSSASAVLQAQALMPWQRQQQRYLQHALTCWQAIRALQHHQQHPEHRDKVPSQGTVMQMLHPGLAEPVMMT